MIPLAPGAARITDVTAFNSRRTKDGDWRPGIYGKSTPFESFADLCGDLLGALASRNVSTDDPIAVAAADRAERTLRSKRPDADATYVRRKATIDAVKGRLPAFAPAVFTGDVHNKKACERVTVFAADLDAETEATWGATVAQLEASGVAWFAYGSAKDGIPKIEGSDASVRRRLLIAISRDVDAKESARLRKIVPEMLGLTPDASTVGDESRLFYFGSVDGVVPYADGTPDAALALDVDAILAAHPEPVKPPRGRATSSFGPADDSTGTDRRCPTGVAPIDHARMLARTSAPAVHNDLGHTTLFSLACDIVCGLQIDVDEARAILWDEFNPRCDPPWEESERKDFDRKCTQARDESTRTPGYLLPAPADAGANVHAPPMREPYFLRSRDGFVTLLHEGDERGYRPIADKIILTRIEELGYAGALIPVRDEKTKQELRVDQVLKREGATYEHTAYAFANQRTLYDSAGQGRVVIGYPRTALAARFDADADAWLRALGGAHYDRLAVWIASCAQQHIDRLSACLMLVGGADTGKSMFGHAVARMWGQAPPPLGLTCVQFNADLLRCPILVDEEAQLFGSKALSTKRFRDMIQSTSRSVERKGKERCELAGAMRAIVNCNGYSDLRFTDLGGPDVIKALADRLLVIDAADRADACRGPLARLRPSGQYQVDLARVAGHMAWLCETITLPAERFLGAGGDSPEAAILAGHVAEHADLWESFRDWLESGNPACPWSVEEAGLCVDTRALSLSLQHLGRDGLLPAVRAALAPYHVRDFRPRREGVRPRLWQLAEARVIDALALGPDDVATLAQRFATAT